MENQKINEADLNKIYTAFKSGEKLSTFDLNSLATHQDALIQDLKKQLDEANLTIIKFNEDAEKFAEYETEMKRSLEKAYKEIENQKQRIEWYSNEWCKNNQLKESLKATATIINTLLA